MFRRLLLEDWQNVLAIISFSIFFAVFLLSAVRVWLMPRHRLEHMENLPLAHDTDEN
jgi:hypothetical protein